MLTPSKCNGLIYSFNNRLLSAYIGQNIVLGTKYKWSHSRLHHSALTIYSMKNIYKNESFTQLQRLYNVSL